MQTSALQFQCLTHLRLELRIKKKIQKEIIVTFYESDFKHLVGVQKLYSEIAGLRQYNATKFFYDVLRSEKIYDTVIASPQYFLIKERVELVGNIRNIIHNQYSVFDYIPKP